MGLPRAGDAGKGRLPAGCPFLARRPVGRGQPAHHPRAGPGAPAAGIVRPRLGGAPRCSGPAPPHPLLAAPKGQETGVACLSWVRLPRGNSKLLTRASTGTRHGSGVRDGLGAAAAGAPTAGPRHPGDGPGGPRSSAMLRFPPRRCPRRPGWDVTPPPASRGAPHGGVSRPPPGRPRCPRPRRAQEAQPGRCLLSVHAASREGQRRGSGRPSRAGPAHERAPRLHSCPTGLAGRGRRRSRATGT